MEELSNDDREKAAEFWIKEAQMDLHKQLIKGKLVRLCARVENGIIIVGGRTERRMEAT